jgi:hypothetical protein
VADDAIVIFFMLLKDTCTKMVSHLVDVDDRSEALWLTHISTQNNSKNLYVYIVNLLL